MDVQTAHGLIFERIRTPSGHFYSSAGDLAIGAGLILKGVRFPVYNQEDHLYDTARGIAYILTHECDLDPSNVRLFNDHVLLCPIIRFEEFVTKCQTLIRDDELRSFLAQLAAHEINRVVYMPTLGEDLPYGGLLYLNQICNCHISAMSERHATKIGSVTQKGLYEIDIALENHLRRPKVQWLSTG